MPKLFIPKKLRVGFLKREGTFDGKLAYVIYYDATGKLRKQIGWDGWRDHNIEPIEWDNVPTSGFMLNKGIKRYDWSGFGTDRIMIRIADPRGAEFEIDPRNLVGLLMHTDCSKRQITDELVYAWAGKELVLLPCNSNEYKAACSYTKLQSSKIGARHLKPGAIYITRNERHLMYLGNYMYYENKDGSRCKEYKIEYENQNKVAHDVRRDIIIHDERIGTKQHIFCDISNDNKIGSWKSVKSVSVEIANIITEHCDDRFSGVVEKFRKHSDHLAVVGYEKNDLPDDFWLLQKDYYSPRQRWSREFSAFTEYNNDFYRVVINRNHNHTFESYPDMYYVTAIEKYDSSGGIYRVDSKNCYRDIGFDIGYKMPVKSYIRYSRYSDRREPILNEIDRSKFFDLDYVFENGMKKPIINRSK